MIKNKCLENFVFQKHLACNESMVKYFGKHGFKIIRRKPIRFGYNMWCVNTKDILLILTYIKGKDLRENEKYNSIFGKAVSPLIIMLELS